MHGDAIATMILLQLGVRPPIPEYNKDYYSVALYKNRVTSGNEMPLYKPNEDEISQIKRFFNLYNERENMIDWETIIYYDRLDKDAHVYLGGTDAETVRNVGHYFYEMIRNKKISAATEAAM